MSYKQLHLEEGESVIFEVRKHWIVFFGQAIALLFSALLPFILFTIAKMFEISLPQFDIPGNVSALFLFLYILWLLSLWILFFLDWTIYYLDVWYVTEKRIIVIDQKRIFDRVVSNIRFDKIQDVTIDVHGFISTFLGFGNIKVQTASEDSTEFYMNSVRHPENVRKIIFAQQNKTGGSKL